MVFLTAAQESKIKGKLLEIIKAADKSDTLRDVGITALSIKVRLDRGALLDLSTHFGDINFPVKSSDSFNTSVRIPAPAAMKVEDFIELLQAPYIISVTVPSIKTLNNHSR
ncbi:MAG: hypothetical protein KGJ21_08200 [Pseudomonadota bacterium]|nr:hypothetical protein [Pseudomonadota bacterium]